MQRDVPQDEKRDLLVLMPDVLPHVLELQGCDPKLVESNEEKLESSLVGG